MRPLRTIALLCAAQMLASGRALPQPNLPPPPPPPLEQPAELPPPPLSPAPATTPSSAVQPPSTSHAPRRAAPPPAPVPPPPAYPPARMRHSEVAYVEEELRRPAIAVTLNPLPLIFGRLSANVEVLLAPHHALIASPNVLLVQADRGGRYNFVSEGFGFVTRTSASFGLELGYRYYWHWRRSLRGPFFGPSLLFGSTTEASVGDPSHAQAYWGLAFDIGAQEVLRGGFAIGAGVGLGLAGMAGATAVFPRVLFEAGWSF